MQTHASPPPPVGALRDDGSVDDAHAGAVADELAVALYEQMVLARQLDDRLVLLQREGRIASHASAAGEEAAIVGAAAALRDEDWVFLASREIRRGSLARNAARGVRPPPRGDDAERGQRA